MKILLASHGSFAEGLKSAIEIILGKQDNLYTINMYLDNISLREKLEEILGPSYLDEDIVIFTDIFGGSVNQKMMEIYEDRDVEIVTGMNLPLLLEVLISKDLSKENLSKILSVVTKQMTTTDDLLKRVQLEDDVL